LTTDRNRRAWVCANILSLANHFENAGGGHALYWQLCLDAHHRDGCRPVGSESSCADPTFGTHLFFFFFFFLFGRSHRLPQDSPRRPTFTRPLLTPALDPPWFCVVTACVSSAFSLPGFLVLASFFFPLRFLGLEGV